jgi:hypothetical protein
VKKFRCRCLDFTKSLSVTALLRIPRLTIRR